MDSNSILQNAIVLYVEDEAFTRKQMSKLLKRKVGKVIVAENGAQGLELFNLHKPDIVIADMIMPVMGGLDMIKEIRATTRSCFIVITTAIGDSETILKTVDIGIDKYLVKPLDSDQLSLVLSDFGKVFVDQAKCKLKIKHEDKKSYEIKIQKEFSHFLKRTTGKGPLKVSAFIKGKSIEIKAFEAMTELEKSLMENRQNMKYVEMNRKLFYSIKEAEIERLVKEIVEQDIRSQTVRINVNQNLDEITVGIV